MRVGSRVQETETGPECPMGEETVMKKQTTVTMQLAALTATLYRVYEEIFGAAIIRLTSNGNSENVFLQTLRWAFWMASEASAGKTTTDFLETVPQQTRGNVRGAILRVESYFSHPKYTHVPRATLGINTLANAIRVFAGFGTTDQRASFSFAKGEVAEGLFGIRTAIDEVIEPSDGYTKAQLKAQLADVFRTMSSAEAQTVYHFLTSTAIDADGLMTVMRYYLTEGMITAAGDERDGLGDSTFPRLLGGFETGAQAGFSVVPMVAERQRMALRVGAGA